MHVNSVERAPQVDLLVQGVLHVDVNLHIEVRNNDGIDTSAAVSHVLAMGDDASVVNQIWKLPDAGRQLDHDGVESAQVANRVQPGVDCLCRSANEWCKIVSIGPLGWIIEQLGHLANYGCSDAGQGRRCGMVKTCHSCSRGDTFATHCSPTLIALRRKQADAILCAHARDAQRLPRALGAFRGIHRVDDLLACGTRCEYVESERELKVVTLQLGLSRQALPARLARRRIQWVPHDDLL